LYLRRVKYRDGYHYVLRESYRDCDCWKYRDLIDLGGNPSEHIEYPGGNGFYFDPAVEEALQKHGVEYSPEELEDVFLPFLDARIRRIVEMFRRSDRKRSPWAGCSSDELWRHQKELHPFDKRRLHYLRCGRVDIGNLEGRPWKFLNVLLGKSRDEIEHVIESMERQLRPQEMRTYLYTAFNLEKFFPGRLTRHHPAALDPEQVDDSFLQEICRLNVDRRFFRGSKPHDGRSLHRHLVKYVILYFDHDFDRRNRWAEIMQEFMRRRQFYGKLRSRPPMASQEACKHIGITVVEFERMSRKELIRLYRARAKKLHPDAGGDHDRFVRLTEAYEALLERKVRR